MAICRSWLKPRSPSSSARLSPIWCFKIVARLVKGLVTAVIAAILAFLISTVPGNLLLSSAFDRIQQEVTTHLPSGIKDQLG